MHANGAVVMFKPIEGLNDNVSLFAKIVTFVPLSCIAGLVDVRKPQ